MLKSEVISLFGRELADITELVAGHAAGVAGEGICTVTALDPGAGILITGDGDPRAWRDLLEDMERVFPGRSSYRNRETPQQTAAVSKSAVFGASKSIPVQDGALGLGRNQRVLAASYSGAEKIPVAIQIIQ